MATARIYPRQDRKDKEGKISLYLRLTKSGKSKYISLGTSIYPKHWNNNKWKVRKSHPNSSRLNQYLTQKQAEAEELLLEEATKNKRVDLQKVKKKLVGESLEEFFSYAYRFLDYVRKHKSYGYYKRVKGVISKFQSYWGEKNLYFDDITVDLLKKYRTYMSEALGNAPNTIYSNFKVIRKIINEAISEDILPVEDNPFLRFELSGEPSQRTYLKEEELRRMETLEIEFDTIIDMHRDMYVFACYAGGIRISDLLQIKWQNITETHLKYTMGKTGDMVSVKLPTKAKQILKKYDDNQDENQYVFPILDTDPDDGIRHFNAISSATAHVNKNLKKLADRAQIDKNITFHTSRHTFATLALRKGMRIEHVSKLLGHRDIKTTQIYAKIVNKDLDEAMEVFE